MFCLKLGSVLLEQATYTQVTSTCACRCTLRKEAICYSLEWDVWEMPQPTSDAAKWSRYIAYEQHTQFHQTRHGKSGNQNYMFSNYIQYFNCELVKICFPMFPLCQPALDEGPKKIFTGAQTWSWWPWNGILSKHNVKSVGLLLGKMSSFLWHV